MKGARFILIMLGLLIIAVGTGILFSREPLIINSWVVNANLQPNGDLIIQEDITYIFNKKFNGVFHRINLNQIDGITNISVKEIVNGNEKIYVEVEKAANGYHNVFTVHRRLDNNEIKIFSPSNNEQKMFRISYTVKNVATRYNDIGELYYQFISSDNGTPIRFMEINLKLPDTSSEANVHVYTHSPKTIAIDQLNTTYFRFEASKLKKGDMVEVRLLFPPSLINLSTNVKGTDGYEAILKEERQYQQKIEQSKKIHHVFGNISIIGGGSGLLLAGLFIYRFRRKRGQDGEIIRTGIPEDCTPAVAAFLMNKQHNPDLFPATILDLMRKGYISLEIDLNQPSKKKEDREKNYVIKLIKNPDHELLTHERLFLKMLFAEIGKGNYLTTKALNEYSKMNSNGLIELIHNWLSEVKENTKKMGYYDKSKRRHGFFFIIYGILIFFTGIITASKENIWGIFALVASFILVFYGISLFNRLSDKGFEQRQQWKKFIKNMEEQNQNLTLQMYLDKLEQPSLIYAFALGVKTEDNLVIKEMVEQHHLYSHTWIFWYFLFIHHQPFHGMRHSMSSGFTGTGSGGFSGGGAGGVSTGGF